MKKLNLDIENVDVQSFPTTPEVAERRGTVQANLLRSEVFTDCRVDCPTHYFMNTVCYIP
jgi:hypothetical protein